VVKCGTSITRLPIAPSRRQSSLDAGTILQESV
jgi:hypothetical protein